MVSRSDLSQHAPLLRTQRLLLRLPDERDIPEILHYYRENEQRFLPTDPPRPKGFHTEAHWREQIQKAHRAFQEERELRFYFFKLGDESSMVGQASVTQMSRGAFQACYLGYSLDGNHEGQGLMTEALQAVIDYTFVALNFHRIMANTLTENTRSVRVLERLGFVREGLARNYLFINGAWRDHTLHALTNAHWRDTFHT